MDSRFKRRHLPHYDIAHATYFVTACLAGSIPTSGLLHLRRQSETLSRSPCPPGISPEQWNRQRSLQLFDDGEEWLDRRPATRWFQDRRLASVMQSAILFHDGKRCDVHAFVVMPSHVHLVFTPYSIPAAMASRTAPGAGLSARTAIMHSIKLFTARACNRLLDRAGTFWQSESYDRVVRDEAELARFVSYVENNPVKAGLCQRPEEWEFSSARENHDGR